MGLRFRALGGGAVNVVKPGRGGRRAMGPPSATLRKNGPDEVARAIKPLECVIFDCDGVIWRGQKKIEGAREAIAGLEAEGKRVLYLTNNSAKSREQCASKLRNFGIEANPSQVVCSSSSAARYLDSVRFDKAKKVLVIGQEGILIELAEAGYECVTCEDLCGSSDPECKIEEYERMEVDPGVGAVVAGVDDTFSYRKLCIASLYLSSRESNAIFVATNLDVGDRVGSDGRLIPGAGPCLAAIQTASGREATNVGKGGEWLLPHLVETLNLDAQRTCIVGDRLDTDIALGKQSGMLTILPLTGVTSEEDLAGCAEGERPDLVVESVAALVRGGGPASTEG
mmetsp:Transcript_10417/g.36996  ORF Transcript_10417/g.36996 Transcript_10417/m.36996 type:complete len:340 (+) Transcript_10417:136-1155(+)